MNQSFLTHMERLEQFISNDSGQDVAEYGLLMAGVGLLVLVGATSLGASLQAWFAAIAAQLDSLVGG